MEKRPSATLASVFAKVSLDKSSFVSDVPSRRLIPKDFSRFASGHF